MSDQKFYKKGIILAGGLGTRLFPLTKNTNKHLLKVFDKPMIFYSISILMLAGIRDICIVTNKKDIKFFKSLLLGFDIGVKFTYVSQFKNFSGISNAIYSAKNFIKNDNFITICGDNIFFGDGISKYLQNLTLINQNIIFCSYVSNPKAFGVLELSNNNKPLRIIEKPIKTKSNYAVTGLYFFKNNILDLIKNLKPSKRGEYEVTDINNILLSRNELEVKFLSRGLTWFDLGEHENILNAENMIGSIERSQGLKIACLEEISYRMGYIDKNKLNKLIANLPNSQYKNYLLSIKTNNYIKSKK